MLQDESMGETESKRLEKIKIKGKVGAKGKILENIIWKS